MPRLPFACLVCRASKKHACTNSNFESGECDWCSKHINPCLYDPDQLTEYVGREHLSETFAVLLLRSETGRQLLAEGKIRVPDGIHPRYTHDLPHPYPDGRPIRASDPSLYNPDNSLFTEDELRTMATEVAPDDPSLSDPPGYDLTSEYGLVVTEDPVTGVKTYSCGFCATICWPCTTSDPQQSNCDRCKEYRLFCSKSGFSDSRP